MTAILFPSLFLYASYSFTLAMAFSARPLPFGTSAKHGFFPFEIRASPQYETGSLDTTTTAWVSSLSATLTATQNGLLNGATYYEFTLPIHRPLGCTVEESLAVLTVQMSDTTERTLHHVFVSKVVEGGNAEKAGVKIGDVIVGVTGLFGDVEDVTGVGIDKVKGLVVSRPDDEPLILRVARGTTVMEDHERALVDLCSDPNLDGKEVDDCIVSYLKDGYFDDDQMYDQSVALNGLDNGDYSDAFDSGKETTMLDEDVLLADMYNLWANDLEVSLPSNHVNNKPVGEKETTKPKPWSSRSSPSGTYVRDPRTGAMRNIDS